MADRFLIVGLGNPGREYEATRHNVGFHCVDEMARQFHLSWEAKKRSKAKIATGIAASQSVLLAKPQTYMNLSGSAVQGLAAFYKIPPERILVIYDEMDIPLGMLRIRKQGGSGGHRGMTDIIRKLGTQNFPRIRLGVGRPPGRMDPAAFLLRPFDQHEQPLISEATRIAVQAIETWLREDIDAAMNLYNGMVDTSPDNSESDSQP